MNQPINPVVTNSQTQAPSGQRRTDSRWDSLAELMASGATVRVTVGDIAKDRNGRPCGHNVSIQGLRGFLPGSQLPRHEGKVELKGQTICVKIIECNPRERGGKLVVSRLAALKDERTNFVGALTEGQEVRGQIASVVDGLGYFVSLGVMDALLHRSETDGQVFNVGDCVTARVRSVDRLKDKVSLTMSTSNNTQGRSPSLDTDGSRQPKSFSTAETRSKPKVVAKSEVPSSLTTRTQPARRSSKSSKPAARAKSVTLTSFADLLAHFEQRASS
jgi:ribosomal protein S1